MPQVTAQHPTAEVHPDSKSPSGSCNDGDDGTCCPGTGDGETQPVAPCRLLLPGFPNTHLWEHRRGALPQASLHPSSLPWPWRVSPGEERKKVHMDEVSAREH